MGLETHPLPTGYSKNSFCLTGFFFFYNTRMKTIEQLPAFFKMLVAEPVFLLFIVLLVILVGSPIILLVIANRQREKKNHGVD